MPAWPKRCQGAVPRGVPGRARPVAAAKTGARSFPSAFLPEDGSFWGPHMVAPGSLGTGGTAGKGWCWPGCVEPRRDGQGDHTVTRPDMAGGECPGGGVLSAEVAPPGRVPSGAQGRPASSVAGHHHPWGSVLRKTFRRGGGAPSSCAWSGQECPGEGGLRATAVPGDSKALPGLPNPLPCLPGTPWGSSMIPPAGRGGPSKRRPRLWSRMGMEAMDGQTDRAVDGDSAAEWLLLLGFWVSS